MKLKLYITENVKEWNIIPRIYELLSTFNDVFFTQKLQKPGIRFPALEKFEVTFR